MAILEEPILKTLISTLLGFMGWNSGQSTYKDLLFEISMGLFGTENIPDREEVHVKILAGS